MPFRFAKFSSYKSFEFNIMPDEKRHLPTSSDSRQFRRVMYMSPASLNIHSLGSEVAGKLKKRGVTPATCE